MTAKNRQTELDCTCPDSALRMHIYVYIPAASAMYNNALFVHLDNVLYDPTWLPKALTTIYTYNWL